MKNIIILVILLLYFAFPNGLKAQVLDQKVSVEYKNKTIEELLTDLGEKYKIQFSYSNNLIPVKQKVSISAKGKPLRQLLDQIFKNTDIGYEAIGNYIVLKKNESKKPVKSENPIKISTEEIKIVEQEEKVIQITKEEIYAAADTTTYFPEKGYETLNLSDSTDKESLRKKYVSDRRRLKQQYYRKLDSMNLAEGSNVHSKSKLKNEFRNIMGDLKYRVNEFKKRHNFTKDHKTDSLSKVQSINEPILNNFNDSIRTETKDSLITIEENKSIIDTNYIYRPLQASLISPLGTNGTDGPRVVNGVSFNLLAGHAAGLEGVEFASLLNREEDHVWGVQFSGLANVVKKDVRGGQFSGLVNLNGGNTQGVQFAGLMNLVSDNVFAVQMAGLMNIVSGNCRGTQAAGFMNVTGKKAKGAQIAGFINVAGSGIKGIQIAGFTNVAADTMQGTQIAGFLNAAKVVKGSQIGVFNFADTVSGVQLGFFSYSRRGYRRVEFWGNEILYGNIAFKTGTSRLHNIFSAGFRLEGNDIHWAYGFGMGGEAALSKRLILNADLICYNLHKNGFTWDELNVLNQFKLNLGVLLSKKTSIFAGPVFNVMVCNHYNAETNTYGSVLNPDYAFYNRTFDQTNISMWVGFNGGIRF